MGAYSPQGSKPDVLSIGPCSSREKAIRLCEATAPPRWEGDGPECPQVCVVCRFTFGLFRKRHHCRNCGYFVCTRCSAKNWPGTMLPPTFHCGESYVRACDTCHCLAGNRIENYRSLNKGFISFILFSNLILFVLIFASFIFFINEEKFVAALWSGDYAASLGGSICH